MLPTSIAVYHPLRLIVPCGLSSLTGYHPLRSIIPRGLSLAGYHPSRAIILVGITSRGLLSITAHHLLQPIIPDETSEESRLTITALMQACTLATSGIFRTLR